ncbi:MAG: hypothetical protein CUN52_03425 [Phototrophicales bacterium]|nr:MAG: hypothetical protein CUN52_03425 [Phototrophicales bacterium]
MKIRVDWDNPEQTVICWHFEPEWAWEDFYMAAGISVALRKNATHGKPIALILHTGETAPHRGAALTHTQNALLIKPDGRDVIVVAGTHPFTQRVVQLFRQLYGEMADVNLVDTLQEARAFIIQRRENTGDTQS